jgi:hypothetical protein
MRFPCMSAVSPKGALAQFAQEFVVGDARAAAKTGLRPLVGYRK